MCKSLLVLPRKETEITSKVLLVKLFRKSFLYFLVGILFSFTLVSALATTVDGDWYYFSVNSENYRNQSSLEVVSDDAYPTSVIDAYNRDMAIGYLGVRTYAVQMTPNHYIIYSTPWYYNTVVTNSKAVSGAARDLDSGSYYAQGETAVWNGSVYQTQWTYGTPELTVN